VKTHEPKAAPARPAELLVAPNIAVHAHDENFEVAVAALDRGDIPSEPIELHDAAEVLRLRRSEVMLDAEVRVDRE
jgi:hypothetical protein